MVRTIFKNGKHHATIGMNVLNWLYRLTLCSLVAGVGYVVLLVTVFDTFHVPSESMTPTVQPDDRGIINKLKLGGRLFDIKAAAAGRRDYSVRRLPGYGRLGIGDVVVFNAPFINTWDTMRMNMRMYYCKRAVAVAGDTLEIADGFYKVRGHKGTIGDEKEQRRMRRTVEDVMSHLPDTVPLPSWIGCAPRDPEFGWTILHMGPLVVPEKGMTVTLTHRNFLLYRKYMEWETGGKWDWNGVEATLDGVAAGSYTFHKDYFFAAGDHAVDSQDSRYYGLVPEDFVVGTVAAVYGSRRRADRIFGIRTRF